MTAKFLIGPLVASVLALVPFAVQAADPPPPVIFGSQLMTQQERIEYRNKMRTFKTQEERDAFRLEHHRLMQARATERGVALPSDVPPMGGRMGPGGGMGMGPGGGMGPGMGRGMGPGGGMGRGMGPGAGQPAQ